MQSQNPPAHMPDPVQPQNPPAHVPDLMHLPNPILPPASPAPKEDAEAHLLRTNDWMEIHNFPDVTKVQRFCLTLTGKARLCYETLRPIAVDWIGLQECFR